MAWTVSSVRVRAPHIALFLFLLGCSSLVLFPSGLGAQTISPQIVEFDPSADHSRTVGGVALVDGYQLRFYIVGGTQPVHVIELGKPTPDGDGTIRFNFSAPLGAWPVNGVVYEARVAAVGPGGSTLSAISNQFVFPGTTPPPSLPPPTSCVYTVSPTSQGFNPAGGTGTATVTVGSGCSWTATRSRSWITITSGSSGTGNGTVGYRVSANGGSSSRSATLTVGGRPVVITQAAATAPNAPAGLRIVSVR